jgi:glycosyltransferase involved in cell wall biosynthesis
LPERIVYVSWAESCSRSDHTARELGGRSYMVYAARLGSRPSTVILKYAIQWARTVRLLRRERPDVVVVMTPPVFAALPVLAYTRRHGAQLVLDAHTAALLHPRWRHLQWLQRWLCRQAATTFAHTEHVAELVRQAGGHATLVPDVPVLFPATDRFPRTAAFTVAVVCSFNYDEPLPAILEAARQTADVRFFVTGNPRHFPRTLAAQLPDNVTLTGFLSVPAYGGLLADADVVLTLTTRNHTMLRGAYEAIYQGTPVIVSDWPPLKEAFETGAVHVDNSPGQIAAAIRTVQAAHAEFRTAAVVLRERKLARWRETMAAITARLLMPR